MDGALYLCDVPTSGLDSRPWLLNQAASNLRRIPMEQAQLDYQLLTTPELTELLSRHINNAAIAKVIKDAMQRRLTDAGPVVTSDKPCD
jgi:hypothetical protein